MIQFFDFQFFGKHKERQVVSQRARSLKLKRALKFEPQRTPSCFTKSAGFLFKERKSQHSVRVLALLGIPIFTGFSTFSFKRAMSKTSSIVRT